MLFAWACLAQWHIDTGRTVNEALLFLPNGGVLASFGPAGITGPAGHRVLSEKVYAELYRPGMTIGEAIRLGKTATADGRQSTREAVEGFNLLGDRPWRCPGQYPCRSRRGQPSCGASRSAGSPDTAGAPRSPPFHREFTCPTPRPRPILSSTDH